MNLALIREAVTELQRRKLRTGLTLLGMVFGVAAIVAMLAVGEGSKREALRLVAELGLDNVLIESKAIDPEQLKDIRTRSLGLSAADGATLAPVCVLGARLARTLFGNEPALGRHLKLNHVWLEVVGVLEDRAQSKSDFEGVKLGLDDERLFVAWETGRARFNFKRIEDEVDGISVRLDGKIAPDQAARVLQALIAKRHGGADDTNLIVPMGLYRQNQQTQRIFAIVMSSIAAVSLLVGGIGIMNIMLANVLERRREVGLKRALGARRRDVVEQFLAEALVIAVSGALLGVLLGAVAAYSIAALAGWSVAWSPFSLIAAVLACVAVGLAFGVFPARQAAALDPIAALRSDG